MDRIWSYSGGPTVKKGANAMDATLLEWEEGGNEVTRLSKRWVVFSLPTLACPYMAPKGSLAWCGGVVELCKWCTSPYLPFGGPLPGSTTVELPPRTLYSIWSCSIEPSPVTFFPDSCLGLSVHSRMRPPCASAGNIWLFILLHGSASVFSLGIA